MSIFEEVKTLIPIKTVLEDYGYNIKAGKIICLWHQEQEPSCHVYEGSNHLYCFGACKKRRTSIDLAMHEEKISSPLEAAVRLAKKYHIPHDVQIGDRYAEAAHQARETYHDCLTAAAEVYHENLTEEFYDMLAKEWGLTRETADKYLFGFAPATANGKHINNKLAMGKEIRLGIICSSGLINRHKGDHFQGRLTFPYWKNGKVVYMIGRRIEGVTPDKRQEKAKYKKLLVHSEENSHVSSDVTNRYFLGEDSVRCGEPLVVTEGVTDCYAAIQNGLPCISPATTTFPKEGLPRLLKLAKRAKVVYICNDSEESGAGEKGALATAEFLENEGITVKIIKLPMQEEQKK